MFEVKILMFSVRFFLSKHISPVGGIFARYRGKKHTSGRGECLPISPNIFGKKITVFMHAKFEKKKVMFGTNQ